MTKNNKCILCDSDLNLLLNNVKDYEYKTEGIFNFSLCKKCALLKISPFLTVEQLKKCYPDDYHGFHTTQKSLIGFLYKIIYGIRFRVYSSLMKNKGIALDVGCADGAYFTQFERKYKDCKIEGVEFIDKIAQQGRSAGRVIYTGTIFDLKFKQKYDLIILNNLIEHVLQPVEVMNKVKELLKPDGKIILETPNIDSWDFMMSKKYWGGLHTPRHIYIFSTKAITKLMKLTGFKIKKISYPLNTDHWALSVQNYFERNGTLLNKGRSLYFKYLLFLFIPINLIQKLFKKTGSLILIAENNSN